MKRRSLFVLPILFSLLFTSCLADYLNEKFGYTAPVSITYVSDYGKTPSRKKVSPDYELTEEDLPVLTPKDNEQANEFQGWFLDSDYINQAESGYKVLEDITLYAKWKNKYKNNSSKNAYYVTKILMFDADYDTGYYTDDDYIFTSDSFETANTYCPSIPGFEYITGSDSIYQIFNDITTTVIEKHYYKTHFSAANIRRAETILPYVEDFIYHFYITDYAPDLSVFCYSSLPKATINLEQCYGITLIPQNAFYQCTWLTEIDLPYNIQTIDHYAFYNCNNLKRISLKNGITTIGQSCFDHCSSLESIEIPNSVTSLNNSCFANCSSLKDVYLSENITIIPLHCFDICMTLETIKIPKQTTDIQSYAFRDCTSLKEIYLPASLKLINNSFENCISLKDIYYEGETLPDDFEIYDSKINEIKGTDNWHFNSY